jgi:effector-associated domain 11 (EAD11)-containing protein
MTLPQVKTRIQELLSANEIEAALDFLSSVIVDQSKQQNTIINLKARLSNLRQDIINASESPDKIQETKNSIRTGILGLKDLLVDKDLGIENTEVQVDNAEKNEIIPIFFSRGTPFNDSQKKFTDYFISRFEQYGLKLETPLWSAENPLLPVRDKLKEVFGCVVLAMERMHSKENIYKPGSPKEEKIKEEFFTTPWVQMEAAMGYQQGLPLLIFSEKKVKMEGMIELGVHEFRVFKVNVDDPSELDEEYYRLLIEGWAKKVRQHYMLAIQKR